MVPTPQTNSKAHSRYSSNGSARGTPKDNGSDRKPTPTSQVACHHAWLKVQQCSFVILFLTFAQPHTPRTPASVPITERDFCAVLDGVTFEHVLEGCVPQFLELVQCCSSVIVCRATPLQKSIVVRCVCVCDLLFMSCCSDCVFLLVSVSLCSLVQNHFNKVTLAIGDGANDVSMIQRAHVGVGVLGRSVPRLIVFCGVCLPDVTPLWWLPLHCTLLLGRGHKLPVPLTTPCRHSNTCGRY